jgi:hypothetical protein
MKGLGRQGTLAVPASFLYAFSRVRRRFSHQSVPDRVRSKEKEVGEIGRSV